MATQYGRVIRVTLPDAGLDITEPRIDFDIQVAADAQQKWAEVKIYNLAPHSYALIDDREGSILIDAGYESAGGASRIFEGVIQRVDRTRADNAFVTLIRASDRLRGKAAKGGHVSLTFEGETSAREVARGIVGGMVDERGNQVVTLGRLDAIPASAQVTNFRAEGVPATQMDKLLSEVPGDVRWYTDEVGVARFDTGFLPRTDAPVIVKSPTTGLVGVPDEEEDGRLSCSILLDPRVKLGSELRIEDSLYVPSSTLKVVGIEWSGTNFRGTFTARLDALPHDYEKEP